MANLLSFFIVIWYCCLLGAVISGRRSLESLDSFTIIPASGPESLVFDLIGEGPYTGVADGRILKHKGPLLGFVEFAHASSIRRKEECDGTTDPGLGWSCGRALGLGFNYRTEELYIADAYFGLCKVGSEGGIAEQLVTIAEGIPLKWPDALDVDSTTGIVYFTDVTTKYSIREISEVVRTRDQTGRLISYNPETNEVKVLLKGLQGPGGVAVSKDGSFVLVSEFFSDRILKYWLKGPNVTKRAEEILRVPAPTNVKRTSSGHFWIATNLYVQNHGAVTNIPGGVKIDEFGSILETFTLGGIYNDTVITEVQEFRDSIYIASLYLPFASVTQKISSVPIWIDTTTW